MLRLITGTSSPERDRVFCECVREAAEQGGRVFAVVPDQYSFESDKKLYSALGAKAYNSIEAAGFNRLAELIGKSFGRRELRTAADNSKLIVMYKAVQRFKAEKTALYYKRSLNKGRFIGEMVSLVAELLRSGVTPQELQAAGEKLSGSLARKLHDVSAVYSYYLEGLTAAGLRDSITAIGDAYALARDNGYFEGAHIFIDGFTSFSFDEYRMVECMLSQAAEVTVSLLYPGAPSPEDTFAVTAYTADRLRSIASEHGIPYEVIPCPERPLSDPIGALAEHYRSGRLPETGAEGHIRLAAGNDIYDETEYVCAEITRLVREEGCALRDIAVAARDPSAVASVLEGTFERYGIPYFIDRKLSADISVIVIFLGSIFECVLGREYRTDAILRYIRSPLCPMLDIDTSAIEDYCITYNVNGEMWRQPFCAHDTGTHISPRLETLRRKIIEPLDKFKAAAEDAAAAEICKALLELLGEIDVSRQVYSVVKRASASGNETQLELARSNKQLWQSVLGAVTAIHDEMGGEKLSLRKFYELFRLMTSQMSVSAPPQKLDAVRCVNAESSRLDNVKVLFLIGANEGVFPAEPAGGGLFTEYERQLLQGADIELSASAMVSVQNERLVVFRTLTQPLDRLYISYSETDGSGKLKDPSPVVGRIMSLFPKLGITRISDLPLSFFCTSPKTAYYKYLERSKDKLVVISDPDNMNDDRRELIAARKRRADEVAAVEQALMSREEYSGRLAALPEYASFREFSVTPETSAQVFGKGKLSLSATRINDYYYCPFMFYCKYGLKLKVPRKIELNPMYRGNYLHRCLEALMSTERGGETVYNDNFPFFTEEQLKEKIHSAFLAYEASEIGGSYGKTPSYYAELEQYERTVLDNVLMIQKEFTDSRFVPELFEYSLTDSDGESLLKIKISDELTVEMRGSIDRVDTFTDSDGKRYVRIVDYKTGSTKLELGALYHGINLQMLIYLLALTDSGEREPAGVQYAHIKEASAERLPDSDSDADAVMAERLKTFKPDGLFVGSDRLLQALNRTLGGAFTPFNFNKDMSVAAKGRQPVTESFLRASEEFARRKIVSLAEKISKGKVPASPCIKEKFDPCTNCDYYPVCGKMLHGDPDEVRPEDKKNFISEIEKIENETKGADTDA